MTLGLHPAFSRIISLRFIDHFVRGLKRTGNDYTIRKKIHMENRSNFRSSLFNAFMTTALEIR